MGSGPFIDSQADRPWIGPSLDAASPGRKGASEILMRKVVGLIG